MKVLISAKMGHGTFQAKLFPMSELEQLDEIYVVRKTKGPEINKVKYINLPSFVKFPLLNVVFTPFYLVYLCYKIKPDFLISYHFVPHGVFSFIAGSLTRTPNIFCQTGGECQNMTKWPVIGLLMKAMLKKAYHFNTPGKQSQNFWLDFGIDKSKITVLHSTINTDIFKPAENPIYEFDYLYVGILNKRKRVDWILNALAENKAKNGIDFKFGIVGEGPMRQELEELVFKNGLQTQVQFLGFQKNVKQFLDKSRIFVMSSAMEGLPVALMEAMACEKLVIAPGVDNIPTVLVDNETGFSFEKDDFQKLKLNLETAFLNFDQLESYRKNARKKILDEYSYTVAKSKWNHIFQKK